MPKDIGNIEPFTSIIKNGQLYDVFREMKVERPPKQSNETET